jgi:hypothetical protein
LNFYQYDDFDQNFLEKKEADNAWLDYNNLYLKNGLRAWTHYNDMFGDWKGIKNVQILETYSSVNKRKRFTCLIRYFDFTIKNWTYDTVKIKEIKNIHSKGE